MIPRIRNIHIKFSLVILLPVLTVSCNTVRNSSLSTDSNNKYELVDQFFCYISGQTLALVGRDYDNSDTKISRSYVIGLPERIRLTNTPYYKSLYDSAFAKIKSGHYTGRSLYLATDVYKQCMSGKNMPVAQSDRVISTCFDYSHFIVYLGTKAKRGMRFDQAELIINLWMKRRGLIRNRRLANAFGRIFLKKENNVIARGFAHFKICTDRPPAYPISRVKNLQLF